MPNPELQNELATIKRILSSKIITATEAEKLSIAKLKKFTGAIPSEHNDIHVNLKGAIDSVSIPADLSNENFKLLEEILLGDYLLPKILTPMEAGIFKSLLSHEEALPIRISIVKAFTDLEVTDVTVLPMVFKEKIFSGINLLARDEQQKNFKITFEINNDPVKSGLSHIRFQLVYSESQFDSSQETPECNRVKIEKFYHVNLLNCTLFEEGKPFMRQFTFRAADDCEELSNDDTIITVELPKIDAFLDSPVEELTLAQKWAVFLIKSTDPDFESLIAKFAQTDEGIGLAIRLLAQISGDLKERASFLTRHIEKRQHFRFGS
ncbi:MAG: hypothetical protein LBC41_03595 [Clostridiales bacterium]|jgi:hypothetical protein|nr:hypothetical protein [Clostridiales bacterium]